MREHMLRLLLFIIAYSALLFPQEVSPKQITDSFVDSRNPRFLTYPMNEAWNSETEIFFELGNDSISDIIALGYSATEDSFYNYVKISSNNSINRNLVGQYIYQYPQKDYKVILWETNENGNWDIVYSVDSGDGWTTPGFLFNTNEDELDASFLAAPYGGTSFKVIFSRGNSVYFYPNDSAGTTEIVFQGDDSISYSNPFIIEDGYEGYYAFSEKRINSSDPYLSYRKKAYSDTVWGEILELFPDNPAVNIKIVEPEFDRGVAFEVLIDGKKKVKWIYLSDIKFGGPFNDLLDDNTHETSDFSVLSYYVITKISDDFYSWWPFSYRYVSGDSTYVRGGDLSSSWPDFTRDIYTKVSNTPVALGVLGYVPDGSVSYIVWEDSSNGKINLFGLKRVDRLGSVNISDTPDFKLMQNYPNPFNPVTQIGYSITNAQHVVLKVYDILGNEIATLVNEEKPSGNYEIEFNGSKFASGVYFYKLTAGHFTQSKKLILLK